MITANVGNEENLYCFLEEHGNSREKRELLFFWGMHPKAQFSQFAVCYAVDCNKPGTRTALKGMVESGLLDTSIQHGVSFYSLTKNEEERRSVLELANLSWERRHLIFKRIEQRKGNRISVKAEPIESFA